MPMKIDRCICTQNTFDHLVAIAKERGLDADELGEMCDAGNRCGLCKPYLRVACETGQTVFHALIVADADAQKLIDQHVAE